MGNGWGSEEAKLNAAVKRAEESAQNAVQEAERLKEKQLKADVAALEAAQELAVLAAQQKTKRKQNLQKRRDDIARMQREHDQAEAAYRSQTAENAAEREKLEAELARTTEQRRRDREKLEAELARTTEQQRRDHEQAEAQAELRAQEAQRQRQAQAKADAARVQRAEDERSAREEELRLLRTKEKVQQELDTTLQRTIKDEWQKPGQACVMKKIGGVVMSYSDLANTDKIIGDLMRAFSDVKHPAVLAGMKSIAKATMDTVKEAKDLDEIVRQNYDFLQFAEKNQAFRIQYAVAFKYLKAVNKKGGIGGFFTSEQSTTKVGLSYQVQCDIIAKPEDGIELPTYHELAQMGMVTEEINDYAMALSWQGKLPIQWQTEDVRDWLHSVNRGKYALTFAENDMDGETLFDPDLTSDEVMETMVEIGVKKMVARTLMRKIMKVNEAAREGGDQWLTVYKG